MQQLQRDADDAEIKVNEAKAKKLHDQLHALQHKQHEKSTLTTYSSTPHYEYKQPLSVTVFTPSSIPFKAHQLLALQWLTNERNEIADAIKNDQNVIRTITTTKTLPLKSNGILNIPTNLHSSAVHKNPITFKTTQTTVLSNPSLLIFKQKK